MSHERWLEKADRLRWEMTRVDVTQPDFENRQREILARWLRAEFGAEPPEDTATLPLFQTSPHQ